MRIFHCNFEGRQVSFESSSKMCYMPAQYSSEVHTYLPVRPQMATFWPGSMTNLRFSKARLPRASLSLSVTRLLDMETRQHPSTNRIPPTPRRACIGCKEQGRPGAINVRV